MKSKFFLTLLFTLLLANLMPAFATINCECGTHDSGITAYTVDAQDCCKGTPGAVAFVHHYRLVNGVYEPTGQTQILGSQAQSTCCPPQQ